MLVVVVAVLCAAARAAEDVVPVHVVYVQFYDRDVRAMNNGNALHVIAPTMHAELEALVGAYTSAHEVVALLTATCTRHTKMTTEAEGVELETFLFIYTGADAAAMRHYALAQAPREEPPAEEPPARLSPREKKAARRAALAEEL